MCTAHFLHVLTVVPEVSLKLCVKELRANLCFVFLEHAHEPSPLSAEKRERLGTFAYFLQWLIKLYTFSNWHMEGMFYDTLFTTL